MTALRTLLIVLASLGGYAFMGGLTFALMGEWDIGDDDETSFLAAMFWFFGLPSAYACHLVRRARKEREERERGPIGPGPSPRRVA